MLIVLSSNPIAVIRKNNGVSLLITVNLPVISVTVPSISVESLTAINVTFTNSNGFPESSFTTPSYAEFDAERVLKHRQSNSPATNLFNGIFLKIKLLSD